MQWRVNNRLYSVLLMLMALIMVLVLACENEPYRLSMENQTQQIVTITINGKFVAKVAPWKIIRRAYVRGSTPYLIEVREANDRLIYSKSCTGTQLFDAGGKIFITAR